ncbi:MAG TPA: YciI family protein [Pseudonocardiaceae bacterium]|jgi:hypothetical protein|nr:YciI family protein [Pseudonocardiaceae bacterium]
MKYVILIYGNPASRAAWQGFSDQERAAGLGIYAALNEDLNQSGEMIVSERLADPDMAKWVSVRDGATMTTDGPFAEVKEQLAGFYLVDCDSFERAVQVAARIPEAGFGIPVEVRPVYGLGGMEM